jgi:glycosyltransferase involved in cell wall biosynthesis
MKVSVIIPAYNEEVFIGKCLESIVNQEELPGEIIVVDNNSTDNTARIAGRMGVKVVKEKNQGLIFARNKGFDSARYEIIARCDADVIVPTDWVKRIKYNFETQNIDALSGPVLFYDSIIKSPLPVQIYSESLKLLLRGNRALLGPNMAVSKRIWKIVKPLVSLNDSLVHEDIDLSINILRAKGKIEYDASLIVKTSARRIKKRPVSFFVEYPTRLLKTFWVNRA